MYGGGDEWIYMYVTHFLLDFVEFGLYVCMYVGDISSRNNTIRENSSPL